MRYDLAIALLSGALLGGGWLLHRQRLSSATGTLAPAPDAKTLAGVIRRRPF